MSLFLNSLGEVSFSDIQAFCEAYQEGVRVEYKETPVNFPKVVSSFANTSGGIWVIGAKEDPTTRTGIITGLPIGPGYSEQIIQSCLTGVYPPLRPTVRVFPLESDQSKCIVVVKVAESTDAPHAIENSTRAYMRTGSVSQPYELADMDRLEYLFKRRQNAESKREFLIKNALERGFPNEVCRLRIIVSPAYPYQPVRSLDEIDFFVNSIKYDPKFGAFFSSTRRIQDGILNKNPHLEVNRHGLVVLDAELNRIQYSSISGMSRDCFYIAEPVIRIAEILHIARRFIGDTLLNLLVKVNLSDFRGIWLQYSRDDHADEEFPGADHTCNDLEVLADTRFTFEDLTTGMIQTVTELMKQVLWAFNRRPERLEDRIGAILRENRLIS